MLSHFLNAAWIQVRNAILKIVLQNHNHGTKNHRKQSSVISQTCPPGCLQLFVCHCTTQTGCPACVREEGNKHVLFRIYINTQEAKKESTSNWMMKLSSK